MFDIGSQVLLSILGSLLHVPDASYFHVEIYSALHASLNSFPSQMVILIPLFHLETLPPFPHQKKENSRMPILFASPQVLVELVRYVHQTASRRSWWRQEGSHTRTHWWRTAFGGILIAPGCDFTLLGCLKVNTFALVYILPSHQILGEVGLYPEVSSNCFKMKDP